MSFCMIKVDPFRSIPCYSVYSFIPLLQLCGVHLFYKDLWENPCVSKWRRVVGEAELTGSLTSLKLEESWTFL